MLSRAFSRARKIYAQRNRTGAPLAIVNASGWSDEKNHNLPLERNLDMVSIEIEGLTRSTPGLHRPERVCEDRPHTSSSAPGVVHGTPQQSAAAWEPRHLSAEIKEVIQ